MKPSNLATYSLFPAAFLLGILAGGVVYSHVAFFPAYLADLPHSAVVVTGKYGINEAPFWLALHPLLLLSLLAALVLNWKIMPRRRLIALSLGIYAAVLGASALYFIPELFAFAESAGSTLPDAAWAARSQRWLTLSHIRGAFCLLAFVVILAALAKPQVAAPANSPGT
jgi:hypothetical protein